MSPDSAMWRQRWAEARIGFHRADVNSHLLAYVDRLPQPPARVFVPLCGKSVDLAWLGERGYDVVGVELVPQAVEELFAPAGSAADVSQEGALTTWRHGPLTVYCGDFFDLDLDAFTPFDGIWDRAALVAMPRDERELYAGRLMRVLRTGGCVLLVSLVYDQARLEGPPYSVDGAEIAQLFGRDCQIELLRTRDASSDNPRFVKAGLQVQVEVRLLHKQMQSQLRAPIPGLDGP